jgi:hypothetical protein
MIQRNSHGERMPKAWDANLRCGSKAAAARSKWDVRFTPKSRHSSAQLSCPLCAIGALFDHLVGGGKHRLRNCQAQGFSGFEVDGELDFRGLLDR